MKLMRKVLVSTFLFVSVGGWLTACGGEDEDDDAASSAAKLEPCKQVCEKSVMVMCEFTLPVDACSQICEAHAQAPAACQDALKALSDCQLRAVDVCLVTGCDAEETAYDQACSG
jgi:hypothetical protein